MASAVLPWNVAAVCHPTVLAISVVKLLLQPEKLAQGTCCLPFFRDNLKEARHAEEMEGMVGRSEVELTESSFTCKYFV